MPPAAGPPFPRLQATGFIHLVLAALHCMSPHLPPRRRESPWSLSPPNPEWRCQPRIEGGGRQRRGGSLRQAQGRPSIRPASGWHRKRGYSGCRRRGNAWLERRRVPPSDNPFILSSREAAGEAQQRPVRLSNRITYLSAVVCPSSSRLDIKDVSSASFTSSFTGVKKGARNPAQPDRPAHPIQARSRCMCHTGGCPQGPAWRVPAHFRYTE